jgi:hypothetical protein
MPKSRFLRGSTHRTLDGGVASSQKREQEQAEANEEQNVYGVTDRIEAQDAEQPHSKQRGRDDEQHVASERQRIAADVAGCMVEVAAGIQL